MQLYASGYILAIQLLSPPPISSSQVYIVNDKKYQLTQFNIVGHFHVTKIIDSMYIESHA